ncbi:hypothetical protein M0R36_10480 [bacterium]|jgi:hypothetical protein|nr:hypothetical protein [bacterium]
MSIPISPGAYSSFTDLTAYVQNVPVSIGFIAFLADKGPDNEVVFCVDKESLVSTYGNPNYFKYGPVYGQGMLNAEKNVTSSGALYCMRVLPTDAQVANLAVQIQKPTGGALTTIFTQDIFTDRKLAASQFFGKAEPPALDYWHPAMLFEATGRGVYYNRLKFRLTKVMNKEETFILDIYYEKDDGSLLLVEYWEVSFKDGIVDDFGQSIFIEDVLERNSKYVRCYISDRKTYDQLVAEVENELGAAVISVIDMVYEAPIAPLAGDTYFVRRGGRGTFAGLDGNYVVWNAVGLTWVATPALDGDIIKSVVENKLYAHYGDGIVDPYNPLIHDIIFKFGAEVYAGGGDLTMKELGSGSDGSLWDVNGKLDGTIATQFLSKAYVGDLDDSVYDIDNVLFDLVFDANYPTAVKDNINYLASILRKDCIALLDNGDSTTPETAIAARYQNHPYNNAYTSLWTNYTKVYDNNSGRYIWVSPTYHLSYIIPQSDEETFIWFAFAGLNRGVCELVKDLRFNPKQAQRDNLYLSQLNYIVRLEGFPVFWQQLSSQSKPSAMQDINIVRVVLYIDRALRKFCRNFIYEQNDEETWSMVESAAAGFLETVKKQRGLYSYSVRAGATDEERKRKIFNVDIILEPTRTTEKIFLRHYIQ